MENNITKIIMIFLAVNDMPKMKEFCTEKMGFNITTEYRQDDGHWWTTVKIPGDGIVITLSTLHGSAKPGSMTFHVLAPDIEKAYNNLIEKQAKPSQINSDLYGPGSDVKWFDVTDPEGNSWIVSQALASWMK